MAKKIVTHAKVTSNSVEVIAAPHAVLSNPQHDGAEGDPNGHTLFILTVVAVSVVSLAAGMCCVILLLRRRIHREIQARAKANELPPFYAAQGGGDTPSAASQPGYGQHYPRSPPSAHAASEAEAKRMGIYQQANGQAQEQVQGGGGVRGGRPQQGMMVLGPPC